MKTVEDNPQQKNGASVTTSGGYRTPLERWKAMARIENAAMRASRRLTRDDDDTATSRTDKTDAATSPVIRTQTDKLTRQRVVDLYYLSLRSIGQISSETGLPMNEIWHILRQWRKAGDGARNAAPKHSPEGAVSDVTAAPAPSPPVMTGLQHDEELRKARLDLLLEAGLPPEEVAARMEIPEAEVWRALGTRSRARNETGTRQAKSGAFYRLRHARARALGEAGHSVRAVAKRLGVTTATMKRDEKLVRKMDGRMT